MDKLSAELEFLSRYFERQGLNGLDVVTLGFNLIANILCKIEGHDEQIRDVFNNARDELIEFRKVNHEQSNNPSSTSDNT